MTGNCLVKFLGGDEGESPRIYPERIRLCLKRVIEPFEILFLPQRGRDIIAPGVARGSSISIEKKP
jgi:hypothetical protein